MNTVPILVIRELWVPYKWPFKWVIWVSSFTHPGDGTQPQTHWMMSPLVCFTCYWLPDYLNCLGTISIKRSIKGLKKHICQQKSKNKHVHWWFWDDHDSMNKKLLKSNPRKRIPPNTFQTTKKPKKNPSFSVVARTWKCTVYHKEWEVPCATCVDLRESSCLKRSHEPCWLKLKIPICMDHKMAELPVAAHCSHCRLHWEILWSPTVLKEKVRSETVRHRHDSSDSWWFTEILDAPCMEYPYSYLYHEFNIMVNVGAQIMGDYVL